MKQTKQPELLRVTVEDVMKGKKLKNALTNGIALVYKDNQRINCFIDLGGVNTIEVIEVALGCYHLYEEIISALKKETSPEFVEEMLKEIAQDIVKHEGPKNEQKN